MIEMKAERFRIELVREAATRLDQPAGPCAGNAVHFAGVKTVEVDRVWVVAAIAKVDANPVTLGRSKCGTGKSPVICPGREFNPRNNFYILVE